MLAVRPALRLVDPEPAPGDEDGGDSYLTVPVPRGSGAARGGPWGVEGDVAWVPAVLLLAASGRCSCDECCAALARRQRRARLSAV